MTTTSTPNLTIDQQDLVRRAQSGDQDAWGQLVARYQPVLRSVAGIHRLGASDVQDVVQTTWLRLVEHVAELRDPASVGAWLITTCRRESLRRLRQIARERPQDMTDPTSSIAVFRDPGGDAFDHAARQDDAMHLYAALRDLPERQCQVLLELMHNPGDYADSAQRLGIPVGSLGPTRQRAMRRLRQDPRLAG